MELKNKKEKVIDQSYYKKKVGFEQPDKEMHIKKKKKKIKFRWYFMNNIKKTFNIYIKKEIE